MNRQLTPQSSLESLKKEAKRWLKALRSHDPEALARLLTAYPDAPAHHVLRDVQHALALEHGLSGWIALTNRLENGPLHRYQEMADALLEAYRTGAPEAMVRHWSYTWHRRTWEGMRSYVHVDLGRKPVPRGEEGDISLDDARFLVAREHGFENWQALSAYVAALPVKPGPQAAKPVTLLTTGDRRAAIPVARLRDWDAAIDMLREQRIPALHAEGEMTDEVLERVSRLEHVTSLNLSGSKQLTGDGLHWLARMPQLQHLDLSGTAVADADLEFLRQLTQLRDLRLESTAVTDAGAVHLAGCEHLERVHLLWAPAGDGAIRALAGKSKLRHLRCGVNVTDAGLALLRELPVFRSWQGGEVRMHLLGFEAEPNYLLLRGSFTDAGIAALTALEGLFALNIEDRNTVVTPAGLAPLATLPNLGWLSLYATNETMPYVAAMPHLRFLMCQDTEADDEGFTALSRSQSIEYIWGRRCYNLESRGFSALANMPKLRALSVSCKNVDDAALSLLPDFPSLRDLMPMDIPDEGYRHIGECQGLEALLLMYCRETTDRATEQLTSLPHLQRYFASYTQITDRTPDLLSSMASLEDVEFIGCAGLTNAGIAHLARLPRLRELKVGGTPGVTSDIVGVFPEGVRVEVTV